MRNGLLKKLGAAFNLLMVAGLLSAGNSPIELKVNSSTGALSELKIQRDVRGMNWLVRVDGTQYAWVNESYGWGLGYFTVTKGRESIKKEWKNPVEISADGMNVIYRESDTVFRLSGGWKRMV